MAAPTPKRAVDALTTSVRHALQCIAQVEVLSTGAAPGLTNNLRVVSTRDASPNQLLLRSADGSPHLGLKIAMEYAVVGITEVSLRPQFRASVTMYMYGLLDLAGQELFAYHWHPAGVSAIRSPHFHASSMPSAVSPRVSNATKLEMGHVHFPAHRIELTELVRFLIIELGVAPRRQDWERILESH